MAKNGCTNARCWGQGMPDGSIVTGPGIGEGCSGCRITGDTVFPVHYDDSWVPAHDLRMEELRRDINTPTRPAQDCPKDLDRPAQPEPVKPRAMFGVQDGAFFADWTDDEGFNGTVRLPIWLAREMAQNHELVMELTEGA